ncbi:MAG: hypothetical protein KBT34_07325 [Prevotella sp.]|nr:hypothetical protein [Candidatus Prevotella equi]
MTKEETKKAIEVMQAYVDGKQIQSLVSSVGEKEEWKDLNDTNNTPQWYWDGNINEYRIKSEKRVRPYTFEEMCEAVKEHGIVVKNKSIETCWTITSFTENIITFNALYCDTLTYEKLLECLVWLDDNSPCGIIEEE